jgi:hypothetical protein
VAESTGGFAGGAGVGHDHGDVSVTHPTGVTLQAASAPTDGATAMRGDAKKPSAYNRLAPIRVPSGARFGTKRLTAALGRRRSRFSECWGGGRRRCEQARLCRCDVAGAQCTFVSGQLPDASGIA